MLVGSATVSLGLATEYGSQMIRMLVLARLLGPTEFGIVVSLNAVYAIVGMSTSIGVDRFLIHVDNGGRRHWLALSHTLAFAQAGVNAALLLLLAWPTTLLLDSPQALGSFLALALAPLLGGPCHMRPLQVQRRHLFWPEAWTTIVANIGGLLASVAAAFLLRDHRALIYGLCATSALKTVMTHLITRVKYRLSISPDGLREALRFGLPLMANGLALALLGQLDRIVVGAFLGLTELGRYGLAMTLVLTPISLIGRVQTMIFQPQLSAAWHRAGAAGFWQSYRRMVIIFAFIGTLVAIGVATLGNVVLPALFGARFAVGDGFMALLSAIALTRFVKGVANLGSLSIGRTRDLMLSNAAGTTGLVPAALCLWLWPTLTVAVVGYLVGELLATGFIVARLERRFGAGKDSSAFRDFVRAVPILAGVIAWVLLARPEWPARMALGLGFLLLAGVFGRHVAAPRRRPARPEQV